MKRFRYRLDRLLRVRHAEQQQQARHLAQMLEIEADHQRRVDQSAQRRVVAEQQIAELRTDTTSAGIQLAAESLYRVIRRSEHADRQGQAAARDRVNDARAAYVRARQQAKALERLKARRRQRWREDVDRKERSQDDEIAARIAAQGKPRQ